MFKNWKFKDILLAILTAAVTWLGGSEAYTYATDGRQTSSYSNSEERLVIPNLYTVQAAMYTTRQVKVANFTDATTSSDLGPFTCQVVKPKPELILEKYREKYGVLYPDAQVGKIQVLKKPVNSPIEDDVGEVK